MLQALATYAKECIECTHLEKKPILQFSRKTDLNALAQP